jgi:hypothetical protein
MNINSYLHSKAIAYISFDFEIIVCPPTSTLKLKLKIDTNYINMLTFFANGEYKLD